MPSSSKDAKSIRTVQITDLTTLKGKLAELAPHVPEGATVTRVGGQNIVTVDVPRQQTIQSFEPEGIKDLKGVRYSNMKGSPTDQAAAKKNSRFRLSDLARGPLSVEAEEEARIEAEVRKRLEAKIEEVREATTRDAHEVGLAAGKEEGKAEIVAQSKPMLESFQRLLWEFESTKTEIFKANEEFVLHMIYQLAKSVILREIEADKEYTKRLVAHILERLGTRENVKIYLGEKEYSSAEALKTGLAQMLGELKNISVELDPDISNSGCRVETDFGEVDARIEVQIQSIAQALGVSNG